MQQQLINLDSQKVFFAIILFYYKYLNHRHLVVEYGAACWDPFREGQINAVDRVQKKAAKFVNLTNISNWETLAQWRKIAAWICYTYKAHSREPAWKAIVDRMERSYYLSRVHHDWKIRNRRQRTDIGKYSFVNRAIQLWNKLPVNTLGTLHSKLSTFGKMVWKVISEVKGLNIELLTRSLTGMSEPCRVFYFVYCILLYLIASFSV